jgi:GTP-binding protein
VKLMKKKGTVVVPVDSAGAGDIVSLCGLSNPSIGHTVSSVEVCLSTDIVYCLHFPYCV